MQVFIIEKNADSVVAIVPVTVQGLNYSPNEMSDLAPEKRTA
jgi:hypothetical protein